MKKNNKLSYFTILTTGRTGSDYLQSCLDGVPGVLTLPGKTYFKNFFESLEFKFENCSNKQLIIFFVKKYKNLFVEDRIENKKANIDTKKFIKIFLHISKNIKLSKRKFIEHIFLSYEKITRNKFKSIKVIINHSHSKIETEYFLKLFPESKLLVTIRNPLNNLRSGIENWRKYEKFFYGERNYFYVKRILYDLRFAKKINRKKLFVKLESSFKKKEKLKLIKFLNINYSKKINIATYNGKVWIGDKLSQNRTKDGSFNFLILKKKDNNFYSSRDLNTLSYFYRDYKKFGYLKSSKNTFLQKIKFSILSIFPLEFEKKTFLENPFKIDSYMFYLKRILLFLNNI